MKRPEDINEEIPNPKTEELPDGPMLTIDWRKYEKLLEESDLSDEEKQEFLRTLWNIIVAFVDLGFGVHPVQQACEQNLDLTEFMATDVVSSKKGKSRTEFGVSAAGKDKERKQIAS